MRVIPRLMRRVFIRKRPYDAFSRIYPFIEFIIWAGFLFWAVNKLFGDKYYFNTITTGIIIVILLIIGYYVIRDFVAGLILKTEYRLKKGNIIKIEDTTGKITKLSYLSFDIETYNHEKVKIPYSKISGKKITVPNPAESLKKFELNISVSKIKDLLTTKKQIKTKLLNSPWTAVSEQAVIKLKNETLKTYEFVIFVFAQNENHAEKIKQALL